MKHMKEKDNVKEPVKENPEAGQNQSPAGVGQEPDKSSPAAQAEIKAKECQDQMLRLKADFENTKKRLERDKVEFIKFANERLLVDVLPVVDTLDRAVNSLSEGHDPDKVKDGLKIAQEELHKILELHGVQTVESVGREFDPKFHEAVAVVESPEAQDGTIVDEIERGYVLNGRLIRPSRVRVAQRRNEKQEVRDEKQEASGEKPQVNHEKQEARDKE